MYGYGQEHDDRRQEFRRHQAEVNALLARVHETLGIYTAGRQAVQEQERRTLRPEELLRLKVPANEAERREEFGRVERLLQKAERDLASISRMQIWQRLLRLRWLLASMHGELDREWRQSLVRRQLDEIRYLLERDNDQFPA